MGERRARVFGRRATDPVAAVDQNRLRDYVEAASDWFFEMDADLRVVYLSERYTEVTGFAREDSLGKTRRELAEERGELGGSALDVQRVRRYIELLESHQPFVDYRYPRRNVRGDVRWWSMSGRPVFGPSGEFQGYRGAGRDVTDMVLAEQRLRESEARYRDLVEIVSDWVWEVDAEGRFAVCSGRIGEQLGVDASGWLGRRYIEVKEEIGAEEIGDAAARTAYREAVQTRSPFSRVVYRCVRPDGDERYIEVAGRPRFSADGQFVGYHGTGFDVTGRVQGERALEALVAERTRELHEAQRDLLRSERLAAIGRLTATVSHELRNPLGTIHATFQTLRASLGSVAAGDERRIERIERNIERCVHIIEELLDFTRTREPRTERVRLDRWVRELLDETPLPAAVVLETALDSGSTVELDAHRMQRVLANVLDNACHALGEVADERDLRLRVATRSEGDRALIAVTDTGIGIDAAHLEHVFEPLYSTRSFGVGLGLPLVRQIVEEHGGEVAITSRHGEGTTVSIALPAADA